MINILMNKKPGLTDWVSCPTMIISMKVFQQIPVIVKITSVFKLDKLVCTQLSAKVLDKLEQEQYSYHIVIDI